MAMTKLHQNKLRRATAVSKPQDEKSKKHFQRKLTSAKQLQSWNVRTSLLACVTRSVARAYQRNCVFRMCWTLILLG